jgi:hypothetical protein
MRRNAPLFALAFIAMLALGWVELQVLPVPAVGAHPDLAWLSRQMLIALPVGAIAVLLRCAALAPCALAVHRHVLLGGDEDRAVLKQPRRVVRFAASLIAVDMVALAPTAVWVLGLYGANQAVKLATTLTELVGFIAAMIVSVRLVLVFPGIALDRADAWREGWRLSRGHWWAITGTFVVCLAGVWVAGLAISLVARTWGEAGAALSRLYWAPAGVIVISVAAALASALYRGYGGLGNGASPWSDGVTGAG